MSAGMSGMVSRLRRMTRTEIADRARMMARVHRQRLQVAVRRPAWDRHALRASLAPGTRTSALCGLLSRGDWRGANAWLRETIASRPARFVLDPQSSSSLRCAIVSRWPGAVADAAARGDAIASGRIDLLGYEQLSFAHDGAAIDWHFDPVHQRSAPRRFWADVPYLDPAIGDHKIIWELNRHQHFLALARAWWLTGDPRYRDAIAEQIPAWMEANPPLVGVNWASMLELAFRSISWLWGLHALLAEDGTPHRADRTGWLLDLLLGIDRQLTQVEHNLSRYFSPNTHLTGEALGLYVAGAALPELAASGRWLDTGRTILLAEIERQIARDGGHAERSTHYHRYTLDFYLLALLTAERIGDGHGAAIFSDAVLRLATFMQAVVDDRGRMPQIGDDDGGMLWPIAGRDPRDVRDSLALAAVVLDRPALAPWGVPEEAFWIGWSMRRRQLAESSAALRGRATTTSGVRTDEFDATGFVAIRDERGDHLVLDSGPHGYLNGGHAHADALSIALAVDGSPLLIDPGTATYTMDAALRDHMRSTPMHNTLTLDGRSSSASSGPFHWRSRADAHLAAARHNAGFAWIESGHDGFAPARHRRSLVHSLDAGWLIVDEVAAATAHTAQVHWHFDPAWHVSCARDGVLTATDESGRRAWLLHDGGDVWLACGDEDSGFGWCAPRYGMRVPTCTARVTRRGAGSLSMITWVDARGSVDSAPVMTRLEVDADADAPAIAVAIRRGDASIVTLLRPGDSAGRDARSATLADCHTDARMLQYTMRDGLPRSLSLADGSHALALRDTCLSVSADAPVADLHLALRDDRLDAWCSTPPARLHVHGIALARVRALCLNGREHGVPVARPDAGITILATDWRQPAVAGPERPTAPTVQATEAL